LLADYGYIGLLLAVAIFFAVTTLLLPFSLSLPARLVIYFRRFRQYLLLNHPVLFNFLPSASFSFLRRFLPILPIVPYNPNPVKSSTFECGMETIGKAWIRFNFRYYFYALVFIALDVLVVFLYPWAVDLRQLGLFGFIGALILIFILVVGYIYAWKKKVLEWK
jgi:NADH-quinone oxidoreductase subunit A